MSQPREVRSSPSRIPTGTVGCFALALMLPACGGGAIASGGAVAKVGRGLAIHAGAAPRAAELCMLKGSLKAPKPGADEPLSETCAKSAQSDRLWQRAMMVMAAHADKIALVASGDKVENPGQLEAALTGVNGSGWIETSEPSEQGARDAVTQLVSQMGQNPKADLGAVVTNAAPHVKTLCEGLGAHLDTLSRDIAAVEADIEKKRRTHASRRCGSLDKRPICVSESVVDRMVYAQVLGDLAHMQSSHLQARDALARFCAAHRKLEESAIQGNIKKSKAYFDVVDAVTAVQPAQPPGASTTSATEPAAGASNTAATGSAPAASATTPSSSTPAQ